MVSELELLARLVLALLFGGVIGYERERQNRPAGLRTHILVCAGSALIMMVSIGMWAAYGGPGSNVDPGRIAAQVVSGIGFLGAGTILREGVTIRGLTTAASLWVAAGIGLAVGGGFYLGAVGTTALVLFALSALSRWERRWAFGKRHHSISLVLVDQPGQLGRIGSILGNNGINIEDVRMNPTGIDDLVQIELAVHVGTRERLPRALEELMGVPGMRSVEHSH